MLNADQAVETPQYIYKVLTKSAWEESKERGEIVLLPIDKAFIHFSKKDQLDRVVGKFFRETPHVVLRVETGRLEGELVFETNPGGTEKYYHLYDGTIPMDAVEVEKEGS